MMQKAIDVGYNKMDGTLRLDELNAALATGWKLSDHDPVMSGGGDILVILEQIEAEDKSQQ